VNRAARLSVGAGEAALFASDMHLGDHDPDTAAQFFKVLDAQASSITHLFLLGDIFEAWVGDDQPDQVAAALGERLAGLAGRGVRVALMRGNRDFLLGSGAPDLAWPERCDALLLDDPTVVVLFGQPVLLAHGDAWCTDDHAYQRFRTEVRSNAWQAGFLSRPLADRLAIAREMRAQSELNKQAQDVGDVNEAAVRAALVTADVRQVIHGHTHRPGTYSLGDGFERWVLPDWLAAAQRGGVLRVGEEGWKSVSLNPPSA
jgi:UDP-2,3-diacylglucosamine hydrolase